MKNKYVIVRGDRSGVIAGTLIEMNGSVVELQNARKLYYWDGAAAVEQLALDGTSKPDNCKFTVTVGSMVVTDAIQVIPATDKAQKSILGVVEWMA